MIMAATGTGSFWHYLAVYTVLQRFLVVDMIHEMDYITYCGYHPDFDVLPEGEVVPFYEAITDIQRPGKEGGVGKCILKITRINNPPITK